jgi:hypothetical protein
LAYFVYSYVLRFGFLDGLDGLVFCRMRSIYQTMVELKKYDLRRLQAAGTGQSGHREATTSGAEDGHRQATP